MTGIERTRDERDLDAREFPPVLDLVAPAIGLIGLIAAGIDAGDPALLSVVRTVVGAAFLGSVTDAMLLGHWYLVQPGMPRAPLRSEEHTSELQSLMRISYAVFCLQKKNTNM